MKINLSIPTSLSEITLEQYQNFQSIVDRYDEDRTDQDNKEIAQSLVSIFCNITLTEVQHIKKKDFDLAVQTISKLLEEDSELKVKTYLNGVQLGFIPDLDDITTGEYFDLQAHLSKWENMHKAMAVLYRKITVKKGGLYLIEDYEGTKETAEQMKGLTMDVVNGAMVFFYNLSSDLLKNMRHYLDKNLLKDEKAVQTLQKNGVDIPLFTQSLTEISLELSSQLKLTSMKHLRL
jgi:hypothetical protein